MRLSIRKCVTLIAGIVLFSTLCFYALQSSGGKISRFEFLEHALHTGGGFSEADKDGTGGWLTRWFPAKSQSAFLGNTQNQRSVSPRRPVYTYFDTKRHHRDSEESAILLAWIESFWASGFKPIVLTEKDAKKHGQYSVFHDRGLVASSRQNDISKWLAMSQRGGLFIDYHV
jgi:hypothetical protein